MERRSYLEPRTYIRPRVHAISRSCSHLHAAVIIRPGLRDTMRYTGPSLRARSPRKPGQGSILLSLSFFLSLTFRCLLSFSQLGSDPAPTDQRVFNYPDKISRDRFSTREVVAIYINSRRWSRALMTNTRLPWPGSHGQVVVIDIFLFETMLLDDFR